MPATPPRARGFSGGDLSGGWPDLRAYLAELTRMGELVRVDAPVAARLEIAEIHRRVIAAGGPALLFNSVRGSDFSVVTNLFGGARRVEAAFGPRPGALVAEVARLPEELLPPRLGALWGRRRLLGALARVGTVRRRAGPVLEVAETPPRLGRLPALTSWSEDGGPFITLPLVYTEHPETGQHNLGIYRMQVHDDDHAGMHFQIGKGGGFHLAAAEAGGRPLAANVFLGGPPALTLAALAPLPENVPELLLASLLLGRRLGLSRHAGSALPIVADAEFCLSGEVLAGERRPEGPFGDHYGYYSLRHDYPVFRCRRLYRRGDAIYPATVVGKPRQEDFYLGDFLQELLAPLIKLALPAVEALWSYGETGYHSLAAAVVRERYRREAMVSAFRILGEGQLALTKFLLVTDRQIDLRDFRRTLEHVLARADMRTDLYVFSNLSMDTLDYTGPAVNEGSKGVLLGLGEARRELPRAIAGPLPPEVAEAAVFCAGCLVVSGASHAAEPELAARLARDPRLGGWPLVVLVDDAARATSSPITFLWTTFTRFEPAADLYAAEARVVRHHVSFTEPVVIDARKKATYPEELFCDSETRRLVTARWKEYFPRGQEMGDSDRAHLD